MKLTKRALDRLDSEIEHLYGRHHAGRSIPLTGITNIFRNARAAAMPHVLTAKSIDIALVWAEDDMIAAINDTVHLLTTPDEVQR